MTDFTAFFLPQLNDTPHSSHLPCSIHSISVALKMWTLGQQYQHHLETLEDRFLGAQPRPTESETHIGVQQCALWLAIQVTLILTWVWEPLSSSLVKINLSQTNSPNQFYWMISMPNENLKIKKMKLDKFFKNALVCPMSKKPTNQPTVIYTYVTSLI